MAPRPPADAVVALRSLDRRFRGLFAGLREDERPDDVAHRAGSEGRSALDHVVAATQAVTGLGRDLERVLVEDEPELAAVGAAVPNPVEHGDGSVDQRLAELAAAAEALADRADRAPARDWARVGRSGDGSTIAAAAILWAAVDGALTHLKAAERTLAEVRRQR